jgi:G3E family GTPase
MVNDFGAINVDAALLVSADEDTIQLSNGCVCCTMGADLFLAIGDVLDGDMRPDHIVIEASGIADPAKIANVAVAEPDLVYQGIITVVDGANILDQLVDRFVGDQVRDQIRVADLIYVSKTQLSDHLSMQLATISKAPIMESDTATIEMLLAPSTPKQPSPAASPHAAYTKWFAQADFAFNRNTLIYALQDRPEGVFRMKGFVRAETRTLSVHVVGAHIDVTTFSNDVETGLVAIGLASEMNPQDLDTWWTKAQEKALTPYSML